MKSYSKGSKIPSRLLAEGVSGVKWGMDVVVIEDNEHIVIHPAHKPVENDKFIDTPPVNGGQVFRAGILLDSRTVEGRERHDERIRQRITL
jgi:hypothetical protein